ncbi:MAG: SUMF1/EgtB/PvdO family nonheme iron enzyme [Nitrospirae bacterium]|nr:SUMF1/EgtB/PvdO family nonheme iron enzyme [Nitrospirota bacterium]
MGTNEEDKEGKSVDYGLTKPWFQDETPAHSVNLPGFYFDRYEVTQQEFAAFVREKRAQPPPSWKDGRYPAGQDRYPVTDVTWYQAEAYCAGAGKRLPTEAEWEKAARGPKGLIYPWGNEFDLKKANIMTKGLQPIGSYPQGASPYHVEDLIGNAWEWTADWYRPYPGNTIPSENYGQRFKVIRGKSWIQGFGHQPANEAQAIVAHESRASYRLYFDPVFNFGDLGFRCAKSG